MNTTLELPDDLVRAVELRALQDGHKLNEAVAVLLRVGLAASTARRPLIPGNSSVRITTDPTTGLPVILGDPNALASKMTTKEMLDLYQETQLQEDLERLGLPS